MKRRADSLLNSSSHRGINLLLGTWSNAPAALAAGWGLLQKPGMTSLDAVEAACRFAEADLTNQTVGVGGLPDRDGRVSVDAAIMLSPARSGAVCASRSIIHPVSAARQVMEQTAHNLIAGESSDGFAIAQGLPTGDLLTESSRTKWQQWRAGNGSAEPMANMEEERVSLPTAGTESNHDTIGVLGLDAAGQLAAGCTTSGLAWKLPGRVGDSPIMGQGLYCHPRYGACVCTGHGELVAGVCGAFLAVEVLRRGGSPEDAVTEVLKRIRESYVLDPQDQVGIIVLKADGNFSTGSLLAGYSTAVKSDGRDEVIPSQIVGG